MKDDAQNLEETAEEHLRERRFTEAAECFEKAAAAQKDNRATAQLLKRAAEVHAQMRSIGAIEDAERCYRQAGQLLDKTGKAECLMAYWRVLILEIAGCAYDCSYEWRGEMDDTHDADHDFYQGEIRQYRKEALEVLTEVLNIEGISRRKIIREAKKEHRRRKKDGWGASICENMIDSITGKGKD